LKQRNQGNKMYQSNISKNSEGCFYALIVRIDKDGESNVINSYKGRSFKSEKAAIKSTSSFIAKMG
jgi:hypothetical protein